MPVPSVPSEQRSQGRWRRCQRWAWCRWRPPCPPPSRGRLPGSPGRCGSAWAPARAAAARSARAPAPVRAPSPALPAAPAAIPPFRPHGACPHSLHRRSGSGSGGPLGAAVMAGAGALVVGGGVAAVEPAQAPGAGRDSSVEQCSCVGEHWSLFRPTQPAIEDLRLRAVDWRQQSRTQSPPVARADGIRGRRRDAARIAAAAAAPARARCRLAVAPPTEANRGHDERRAARGVGRKV